MNRHTKIIALHTKDCFLFDMLQIDFKCFLYKIYFGNYGKYTACLGH